MTLLDDVELVIQERQMRRELVLFKKEERGYLLDGNATDKYGHRVDFWITPVKGLYSVCELQCYFDDLCSGFLAVESKENFRQEQGRVYFGRVQLGEEISAMDAEKLRKHGSCETHFGKLERRITLKLFPDELYVRDVVQRNLQMQYGCSLVYLEKNRVGQELRRVA